MAVNRVITRKPNQLYSVRSYKFYHKMLKIQLQKHTTKPEIQYSQIITATLITLLKSKEAKHHQNSDHNHPHNMNKQQSLTRTSTISNFTMTSFYNTHAFTSRFWTSTPIRNAVHSANWIGTKTTDITWGWGCLDFITAVAGFANIIDAVGWERFGYDGCSRG